MLLCYSPQAHNNYKTQNNSHYDGKLKTDLTFV